MKTLIKTLAVIGCAAHLAACATSETVSSATSTVDAVTPDVTLNQFLDLRITALQKEAAAGQGENLDALAELMGSDDRAAFASMMQTNYDSLFSDLEQPAQLTDRIEALRPELAI